MSNNTFTILTGLATLALLIPVFKNPTNHNSPTSLVNYMKVSSTMDRKHISSKQAVINAKARRILGWNPKIGPY